MPGRALVSLAALTRTVPAPCRSVDGVRRSAHEKLQRSVSWTRLRTLAQRRARNRPHDGPATAIHHSHDHLRRARQIEDDPVDLRAFGRDLHEVACSDLLHWTEPSAPPDNVDGGSIAHPSHPNYGPAA
jgi:hypothetical protein